MTQFLANELFGIAKRTNVPVMELRASRVTQNFLSGWFFRGWKMFKILLAEKAKMAGLLLGIICIAAAGAANAITYTYSQTYSSCDTLTVSSTGAITCNCNTPFTKNTDGTTSCNTGDTGNTKAFHFNFVSQP